MNDHYWGARELPALASVRWHGEGEELLMPRNRKYLYSDSIIGFRYENDIWNTLLPLMHLCRNGTIIFIGVWCVFDDVSWAVLSSGLPASQLIWRQAASVSHRTAPLYLRGGGHRLIPPVEALSAMGNVTKDVLRDCCVVDDDNIHFLNAVMRWKWKVDKYWISNFNNIPVWNRYIENQTEEEQLETSWFIF